MYDIDMSQGGMWKDDAGSRLGSILTRDSHSEPRVKERKVSPRT